MFNRNEYARQCGIVNKTPLYRATSNPADELGSLRDDAIEQIAEDKLQEAIADPDIMSEFVLENGYDQEGFKEMATALAAMMDAAINDKDNSVARLDSRLMFSIQMQKFIELKAVSLAEEEIDG